MKTEQPPVTKSGLHFFAPFADVSVAPENPRAKSKPEFIEELAASIKAHGLLRPLLVYEEPKGKYKAVGGSRRIAALKLLKHEGNVAIIVRPKAEAIELALADNMNNEDMTVAEAATAWAAMVKKGDSETAIANAFGVTELTVKRYVGLAKLHPPIFAALADNKLGLELAKMYATATLERQAQLWKQLGANTQTWKLREALQKGKISATDRLAKFVGEEAYVAAGGKIETDLFNIDQHGHDDDEDANELGDSYWISRQTVEKLADAKLDAEAEKLKKAGWGFVARKTDAWYNTYDYARGVTKKGRALFGVLISIDHNGKLETSEVVKRSASKGGKGKASAPPKPIKKGPQPPMTNTTHELLTRAAGAIVGRSIMANPEVALIAMTAQLARVKWSKESSHEQYEPTNVINLRTDQHFNGNRPALKSDGEMEAIEKQWLKLFKDGFATAEDTVAAMAPAIRGKLFAYLVGELVVATERHPAAGKARRVRLAALGRLAKADPAYHWAPNADFLKGFSRAELTKVAKELGVEEGKTKTKTAEAIAIKAKDIGWTPALVRQLVGAQAHAAKPPAALAKKAAAKKRELETA